jgi:ferrous iron transport protein B
MPDSLGNQQTLPTIALVGNPNTGKSTLFNNLTGLRQKTANYPGVTVERHTGLMSLGAQQVQLIDLPGSYSLAAYSPDELVSADVLLGRIDDIGLPDAVMVVVDATNLRRNLFMATQILELGLPVVIAMTMTDLAAGRGIKIDSEKLSAKLGVPVVPIAIGAAQSMAALKSTLASALGGQPVTRASLVPAIRSAAETLHSQADKSSRTVTVFDIERALIDLGGAAEQRLLDMGVIADPSLLQTTRDSLAPGSSLAATEARARYAWIDAVVNAAQTREDPGFRMTDVIDRITSHSVFGSLLFLAIMATVFQAVFSWAGPLMDLIDAAAAGLSSLVTTWLPEGAIASFITDGVIAGVGSVVIFLPQILILFAFIIFLEDSGYMARAAFLMDRLMRACGLSGQSFIPMLSSFACAIPGIMATRVIPNPRDRIATMLAAPFMTCSARLPVYALLIAAFVPDRNVLGVFNLQGLTLFGLYMLGIVGGIFTALVMKRFALRGPTPPFLIEIPPYRLPNFKSMAIKLLDRGKIFLYRAGTVIFSVAVVIWALVYFPRPEALLADYEAQRTAVVAANETRAEQLLAEIDNRESAALLEQSFLGRAGRTVQPIFAPLGWDWKVTAGVIASFPAREVVVAVLGTVYAVGGDVDETDKRLLKRLQNAKDADGNPVFTPGMAVGLMIFFAFCLQCMATVAVMRRETNGWKWPIAAWCYMTGLGYLGALLANQLL